MTRIVAIANQKGGVGKTTTAINLAASLALADQRILLVDVDPQANLTSGVGQKGRASAAGTIYDALTAPDAIVAADAVLIPLHCEYFALEGLADLVGTLKRVRAAYNPALDIEGVLLTMFDERTNLGQQVATDVRGFFKEKVFRTVIPRNVRLGEAPSHGMPVILYDIKSRGAEAYLALAKEVIERAAAPAA